MPAFRINGGKLLVRLSEFHAWMARRRYKAQTVDAIVHDVFREMGRRA